MLPGPGDGPDVPVLVPGGPGMTCPEIFSAYFYSVNSEVSFGGLRFALVCSLGQGMVHLDLFQSLDGLVK